METGTLGDIASACDGVILPRSERMPISREVKVLPGVAWIPKHIGIIWFVASKGCFITFDETSVISNEKQYDVLVIWRVVVGSHQDFPVCPVFWADIPTGNVTPVGTAL